MGTRRAFGRIWPSLLLMDSAAGMGGCTSHGRTPK